MGPALFDYNMRLIQLSVIQLSGGHCILFKYKTKLISCYVLTGKAQKKKKQPNSPIACSPVKNAEKLISTKKSSKKVVDETVVVAESKPTVAVAAAVKSPQQQNSPNKTSHCDAKVTSESDFASYVTRTLLKGLANETPTSSKIMKVSISTTFYKNQK